MARQNTRNAQRERSHDAPRRDAAGSSLRVHISNREQRVGHERDKESRVPSLNRYDWNDLYERSSV